MIQRTFSSPFFIQFQIRSDHPSELLRQKRTFSWPIPNLLVIIPLSKSELTLRETPELVFSTILSSILSFSHVPSSIIYQGSRRMLRARRNRRARQSYGFHGRPGFPEDSRASFSFSFRIYKFALQFFSSYTQNVFRTCTGKCNSMSTGSNYEVYWGPLLDARVRSRHDFLWLDLLNRCIRRGVMMV